jgi:hypothetical protein
MTAAGRIVELRRYRIPAGERALKAQRIDGRVAVMDVPVDHADRVYLVERHVQSQAELEGLAAETPSAARAAASQRSSRPSKRLTSSPTRSPPTHRDERAPRRR